MLGGSAFCHPIAVPWCHVHLGPIIDDMLGHIELVFDRLKQFNLNIKPKKCRFFKTSVTFLGHNLLAEGISAKP